MLLAARYGKTRFWRDVSRSTSAEILGVKCAAVLCQLLAVAPCGLIFDEAFVHRAVSTAVANAPVVCAGTTVLFGIQHIFCSAVMVCWRG